jgi:DNA-directed RNA polymerase subunit M/transcription elongation factor TFIIS
MEPDPAEQWQRMQEVYSQMSEGELQKVADEAYDLTDLAREVLQAEIKTRGLKIELRTAPVEPAGEVPETEGGSPEFDPADLGLSVTKILQDEEEARTAKWVLDNSGIASFIGPNNVERVEDYHGSYEHGVALKVRDSDRYLATMAFVRHLPNDSDADHEPDPPPVDVRCPKCHSEEVVFESLNQEPADDAYLDAKFNWRCDACGYEWQDDGVEKEV